MNPTRSLEMSQGKLLHSPVRKSPRLHPDADATPTAPSDPKQPASETGRVETQEQPAISVTNQPVESNGATQGNHKAEMQSQIDALKRQLADAQTELSKTQRQCSHLQSVLRDDASSSSPNCRGLPLSLGTLTETSLSGHAVSTTCTPQPVTTPIVSVPENRYTNTDAAAIAIPANPYLPLAALSSAINFSLPQPTQGRVAQCRERGQKCQK